MTSPVTYPPPNSNSTPPSLTPMDTREEGDLPHTALGGRTDSHASSHASLRSASSFTSDTESRPGKSQGSFEEEARLSVTEAAARELCMADFGASLMSTRIRQTLSTSREVGQFLKRRAAMEDDYGRGLVKLARTSRDAYAAGETQGGSFAASYYAFLRLHEFMGESHLKLGAQLHEMVADLAAQARDAEQMRKSTRDMSAKLEKNLADLAGAAGDARAKLDAHAEDLDRLVAMKQGDTADSSSVSSAAAAASKGSFSRAMNKLKTPKSAAQIARLEDDTRAKLGAASDAYHASLRASHAARTDYHAAHVPRLAQMYRDCINESDLAVRHHLMRYAHVLESTLVADGVVVAPLAPELPGLRSAVDAVDPAADFAEYASAYAKGQPPVQSGPIAQSGPGGRGIPPHSAPPQGISPQGVPPHVASTQGISPHPQGAPSHVAPPQGISPQGVSPHGAPPHGIPRPQQPGIPQAAPRGVPCDGAPIGGPPISSAPGNTAVGAPVGAPAGAPPIGGAPSGAPAGAPSSTPSSSGPSFSVPLEQCQYGPAGEAPLVLEKCIAAIDKHGLDSVGIYRLSGTSSRVKAFRARIDADIHATDLLAPEFTQDINDISGLLKLWLRELPEPLLTFDLYPGFVDAARIENPRLRHIRVHERVNELPDANYSTLKALMAHLDRVARNDALNQMSRSNLAIVFGPNLLGARPNASGIDELAIADMSARCKCVETILEHYSDIFVAS